jgi:hypothetical protein
VVFRTLRQVLGLVYYQDPRSWPALGYEGPTVARARVAS